MLCLPASANAQRDLKEIPAADPVAEMAAMSLDTSAAVNLFAADPDIRKPIQANFDSRGRLWVASSEVYPQITPGEKADDKIIVLEDTDGDGASDRSTVFADGLLIPTGVVPDGSGGAYVGASTELLHLTDTDGDGRADRRQVVLSGFGTEDTHHLVHTLRWGPDGCLYFNQSIYIHSHIETAYGTRHLEGGGVWRYRPETGELSVVCKGFINPWGHVFNAVGESFVTDGAYFQGINYIFPGAVFVASPGETRFLQGMNPGSPKHCGLEILSGNHIPPDWSGDLMTSDFRGQRVCRFSLASGASTYSSRQQPEIVTSSHLAFRPIGARMGPDGAIYVADWYNPIIQHGEVDFRDERRDREHGRIWRISFPGRPLDQWPDFESATADQLIAMLESPSLAVRQFAREHLWPKVRLDADTLLRAVAKWRDAATDDQIKAARALEQQWLGEVAGRFERDAFEVVTSGPAGPASRTSLRSASRVAAAGDTLVNNVAMKLASGDDAASRLEAIIMLGNQATTASVKQLLQTATSLEAPVANDPATDFALWQAVRRTQPIWTDAIRQGELSWREVSSGLAYAVTAAATPDAAAMLLEILHNQSPSPTERLAFTSAIAQAGDAGNLADLLSLNLNDISQLDLATKTITALVARTERDRTIPTGAPEILAKHFPTNQSLPTDERLGQSIVTAIGTWNVSEMIPQLLPQLKHKQTPELRSAVFKSLAAFDSPQAKQALLSITKQAAGPESALAVEALATKQPIRSAELAANLFAKLSDEDLAATSLMASLLANSATAKHLPEFIAKQTFDPDRARSLLSAAQLQGASTEITEAIRTAGQLNTATWKLTPELRDEILALAKSGDAAAGEAIYRRSGLQCIQCHGIGVGGGLVGPNLISLGASAQPDYILESLLDPNAKLKEGYNTTTVLTDDGRVAVGIAIGRDAATLQLRLADGKEAAIPVAAIEDERPGKSLMPTGLVDTLTKQQLVDLNAFLSSLGRVPAYTVSTMPYVRTYETLTYSNEANSRLNRTSLDTAATDDPALVWQTITTRVDGNLPISELDQFQPHKESPPISFLRFAVRVDAGQVAKCELPTEAIQVWLDGRPIAVEKLVDTPLMSGVHQIVVGINRQSFSGPWRVLAP